MTATKDGLGIEKITVGEAAQTQIVGNVPEGTGVVTEIPKSPQTPQPKKDKQVVGPICMSPRNPQHRKLSMEDEGKAVTIETNEEEEDLQALIAITK